jgi:Domain of unknown function (DUF4145)
LKKLEGHSSGQTLFLLGETDLGCKTTRIKMSKTVTPSLGLDSYSCPHCGALAQQFWQRVFINGYERGKKPELFNQYDLNRAAIAKIDDDGDKKRAYAFADRFDKNVLTYRQHKYAVNCIAEMVNMAMALCHSCGGFSIWVDGSLVYPESDASFIPQADMPSDVKVDFEEAAAIFQKSPRGAAALLRLAIQKLMPHLDEKGKDLNVDIGKLVAKGLDPIIQQALDVVRVIGNNAVHPGKIDLNDNPEIASKLFGLVNIIVTTMITARIQISAMFESLPVSAKAAIEKRDAGND